MDAVIQNALNKQINAEMHSAYLYLAMSAQLEHDNLPGFAHWMRLQSEEENFHAMKLFDFVNERGGRVVLDAIPAPPEDFGSVLDVFKAALAHEKKITGMINDLYALAIERNDYPAQIMLQWFISEQVEEESNAGSIVTQLEMIGDSPGTLLVLDRQMAARQAGAGGE
jgi:ferritin